MKQTPLISIIVPVYNVEKYLGRCLDSLLLQTYSNLEIICINDGSEDRSLKILKKYAKKDKRIKITDQENQGQSHARNRGRDIASGDYISFVDSDDWVSLTLYNKFVNALNQSEFDIYMFNYTSYLENPKPSEYANKNGIAFSLWNNKNKDLFSPVYKYSDCKDLFGGNMGVWNKIYKKELIKDLRFEENYIFEDQLFYLQTILNSNGIYINNEVQYFYRQADNSTVHTLGGNVFDVFLIQDRLETLLKEKSEWERYKYCYLQHKFNDYMGLLLKTVLPLKEQFYNMASDDLKKTGDFDAEEIKPLHNSHLYFDMTTLTYQEFMNKISR